jgi:hypothetical protein
MMTKTELIELLKDKRQAMLDLVEDLDDEILLESGVTGDWSIKDILAHLAYWEGQTVTLLFQIKQGAKKPTTVHFGDESVDTINERWHQQGQERSLAQVWEDFVNIRRQTIRRVTELDEKDLVEKNRFAWLKGVSLMDLIISDTIEHDEEHTAQIREWLGQRKSKQNGSSGHN